MKNQRIGDYIIKHILGEGAVAEVWYAENKIGKPVAIKVLKNRYVGTGYARAFEVDAERMARLSHPHIRQVYDLLMFENRPAMVMEYLDGVDLGCYLKKGEQFADSLLFRWWNQAVSALNYAHRQGVVHRNIKPSNIFITKHGGLKLLDFDVACVKTAGKVPETRNPLEAVMYMSPEQVQENEPLTHKTDAYSLAVVFYHALQRKAPYSVETDTRYTAIQRIVSEPLALSHLPEVWRGVLDNYLQKNPSERRATLTVSQTNGSSEKQLRTTTLSASRTKKRDATIPILGVASAVVLLLAIGLFFKFKNARNQEVITHVKPQGTMVNATAKSVKRRPSQWKKVNNAKDTATAEKQLLPRPAEVAETKSEPVAVPPPAPTVPKEESKPTAAPAQPVREVATSVSLSDKYDHVGTPNYGLSVAVRNRKWGLVDKNGTLVIPLKYDWIFVEKENFIRVKSDGKEFIINRQGVCIKDCP